MFGYEHRRQRLAPRHVFLSRIARSGLLVVLLTAISLLIGMAGYMGLAGLSPLDAFLNAAMILSGMGPLAVLDNPAAKLFAGIYALYSGFFVLIMAGLLLAPVAHRIFHRFHISEEG